MLMTASTQISVLWEVGQRGGRRRKAVCGSVLGTWFIPLRLPTRALFYSSLHTAIWGGIGAEPLVDCVLNGSDGEFTVAQSGA